MQHGLPGCDTKKVALRRSGNCCLYRRPYLPVESTNTNSTLPRLSSIIGHDLRHRVNLATWTFLPHLQDVGVECYQCKYYYQSHPGI